MSNTTEAYFKELLRNNNDDYLANVASWADSIRYTKWGRFSKNFHFIDAHDAPPHDCNVNYQRDCKEDGCVVSALANYTTHAVDGSLPAWERAQAAKFVIHFVGDLHQPLHNEDVSRGGNGIYVLWDGREYNLHHVWDSSIAEKSLGGLRGKPYNLAKTWAGNLIDEIESGQYATEKESWLKDLNFADANGTAMAWAQETNRFVCSHGKRRIPAFSRYQCLLTYSSIVFPEGPKAIVGKELGGEYYENAAPVIQRQVARAGYRMAAWLDNIADKFLSENPGKAGQYTDEDWDELLTEEEL